MLLYNQDAFDDELSSLVRRTILSELNIPGGAPSSTGSEDEKNYVRKCLQLLLELKDISQILITELMVQYILAPPSFR